MVDLQKRPALITAGRARVPPGRLPINGQTRGSAGASPSRTRYTHPQMHWVYYTSLIILLVTGLFAVIFGLPGLWVMIAATIAYAAVTSWQYVGLWTIVILILIGILAEIVETAAGGAGAKKEGASKRGILGAIIGGILGGIFLS